MSNLHNKIRILIDRVLSEDREPLKDTLDHEDISDVVHALHDTWEGGEKSARWDTDDSEKSPEQGNLVAPKNHVKDVSVGDEDNSQEVIDHSTGEVIKLSDRTLSMKESTLRSIVSKLLENRM